MPTLIVAADFAREPRADDYGRAAAALGEAAELAGGHRGPAGARVPEDGPLLRQPRHRRWPWSPSAAEPDAGVCLDLFHYYTGPSKFEDLAYLSPENLAWVQVCDLSGTPRELAGDGDRILPGEGEFQIGPILDHLGRIGYDGHVSLEVLNPQLWQVPADRVADLGYQAVCRVLGRLGPEPPESTGRALSVSTVATMRPAAIVFREEQYFDWRVYALIADARAARGLLPRLADPPMGPRRRPAGPQVVDRVLAGALVVGLALPFLLVVCLLQMTTEVTPTEVRVWFGWVPIYRRVVLDRRHPSIPASSSTARSPTTAAGASAPAATASASSTPAATAASASSSPTAPGS